MAESQLTITLEEKDVLQRILESTLNSERVEEHRTERSAYRALVQKEIAVIESLLEKLNAEPERVLFPKSNLR
jgi:hypothetical protein